MTPLTSDRVDRVWGEKGTSQAVAFTKDELDVSLHFLGQDGLTVKIADFFPS